MAKARKSITYRKFYDMVMTKVKNDPDWDDSMLEYISFRYGRHEGESIGTHNFDVTGEVLYGSNEGIVCRINMYIATGYYKHDSITLAVLKTLGASREDFMKMGRLAAVFSYNAMQVAEEHINEF